MSLVRHLYYLQQFTPQMTGLKKSAELSKKDYQRIKMMYEKEVVLIKEQMDALRTALKASEKECNDVKRELDKEVCFITMLFVIMFDDVRNTFDVLQKVLTRHCRIHEL